MKKFLLLAMCFVSVFAIGFSGCGNNDDGGRDVPLDFTGVIFPTGTYEIVSVDNHANANNQTNYSAEGINWRIVLDEDMGVTFFKGENSYKSAYTITGYSRFGFDGFTFDLSDTNDIRAFFNNNLSVDIVTGNAFADLHLTNFVTVSGGDFHNTHDPKTGRTERYMRISVTTNAPNSEYIELTYKKTA